ncbi:hypothetical protein FE697_007280 [Mumia zhuanghuii]|uniref:Uncharacterized protein n=2 Tax=Mumia TaxID=1546255 RepID=A0ABW1QN46_9ACTN|nr:MULTISPECIES: hypothetical protein [Mumia]KAA1423405.1 hypothetical protein FE697_007280 [Mumia zhuanghuii]
MSRRRRSIRSEHEHLFVRRITVVCPLNAVHRLGEVVEDASGIRIHRRSLSDHLDARLDDDGHGLRRDGERLRASCARCLLAGERGDHIVAWRLVVGVLTDMRAHGPASRTLPLDARRWRAEP